MALPATDNFTGTTNDELTTYSSNWTDQNVGEDNKEASIQSNQLGCPTSAGNFGAYWNADSFDNDQYSEADFYLSSDWHYFGVTVRAGDTGTGIDWYSATSAANDGPSLDKVVNDSGTQLSSAGSVPSSAERVTIEANGTTIRWLIDDVQQASATDSSIASGAAGLKGYGNGSATGALIDDWEGGDIAAAGTIIPLVMHHFRQQGIT